VSDLTGEIIDGRYQLEQLIAAGGMASIYKGSDLRLDRPVAVKIMHPHLANDEEFVNRFIREAKATAALSHPNVVAIQDQGWNTGGIPAVFIVMEFIDGFTLRDLLFQQGPLSPTDLLRYMIPVASGLAEAHRLGINHRDLKPENILISKDGRIKIADFGLARGAQLGATMTVESSIVLGSVSYLSPEQVQRGVSDARSDIYSLGIVLFELLTGRKPFDGDSPIQIAYKHVNERVPAPTTFVQGIPKELDDLIVKATAPNPDARQMNASELLDEMRQVQESLDPQRKQLSLELDLPVPAAPRKKRARPEVRIGSAIVERVKTITQPISTGASNTSETKKVENLGMSNTAQMRRKTSRRVRRNRFIALFILLGLLGGGYYLTSGTKGGISIPSVVGMSQNDATQTLAMLGLKTEVAAQNYNSTIPAGQVISSNPGGGGHVKKNGTVQLSISLGAQPSAVNPTPTPTPSGGGIALQSYVGQSGDQAQSELTAAGFVVKSTFGFSDSIPPGNVISQTPDAPAIAAVGGTVNIVVSQGSALVYVPNVYSLDQNAATTALENLDLKVIVKKIGSGKRVTNVSPQVGKQVKRGTQITITLG